MGSFENAWTENIKLNKVGEFIEGEKQNFPESRDGINFKRYYHATSRGLLINELVRRIHPQVPSTLFRNKRFAVNKMFQ